jgi:hypothetical protein
MKINKKLRLYLDDIRTPKGDDWVVVRNYDQFVSIIRLNGLENFDLMSLDHDLGDQAMEEYYTNAKNNYQINYENIINEKTGYDCCKFLVSESMTKNIPLPQIYVHSANPIGAHNMIGYINNYLKNCRLPDLCREFKFEFTIDENLILSPEARKAKWDRSNKK